MQTLIDKDGKIETLLTHTRQASSFNRTLIPAGRFRLVLVTNASDGVLPRTKNKVVS